MDFNFNIDWIAALPEIYIFIIINFLIVYAVIYSTSPHLGYPILIRNVTWLGVQILVFALLLNLLNPIPIFKGSEFVISDSLLAIC